MNFADEPVMGHALMPHYPLTYEKLAKYGFDPSATVLYALEPVSDRRNQ